MVWLKIIFFYSGHGYSRLNNTKGYIVPVDAPDPNVDKKGFLDKAVDMNLLVTWSENIEAKHALFLFDSCFSGTIFRGEDRLVPKKISKAMAQPIRYFITAGSANEKVPASSTFTPAFVDALRHAKADKYKDGYVTGEELGLYLKNTVQDFTNQTPQYGKIGDYKSNRGDFVFKLAKKKSTPVINVAELDSVKREKQAELAELDRRIKRKKAKLASIRPKSKVFQDRLKNGGLGPKMVRIPAGSFRMGDIQGGGYADEQPVHRVSVGKFAMGMYEVTFAEYDKFADATDREKPDDEGWGRGNRPVINVSWNDATVYAKWLSNQTGKNYRLPTEAEWEYAARAGTETKYWWGNTASHEYMNYSGDTWGGLAKGKDRWKYTSPVGSFSANKFGLYDTSGNVWEWTCSEYKNKYNGYEKQCVSTEKFLSLRGGSWYNNAGNVRSADRNWDTPSFRNYYVGFRVSRL
jgi:formylglycine-generating enzyme required for sulfatase activity